MRTTDPNGLRAAGPADAAAIAVLLGDLGYEATPGEVAARLDAVARGGGATLVLETDGVVVGCASAMRCDWLHRPRPVAWLTVLVVRPDARGRGAGRRLVAGIEALARAWGCESVELTSNDRRADAHRFYVSLGFESHSRKFVRRITG